MDLAHCTHLTYSSHTIKHCTCPHSTLCKLKWTNQRILHFPCDQHHYGIVPFCSQHILHSPCDQHFVRPPQPQCQVLFCMHWSSVNANIWRQHVARYSNAMTPNFQNDKIMEFGLLYPNIFRIKVLKLFPENLTEASQSKAAKTLVSLKTLHSPQWLRGCKLKKCSNCLRPQTPQTLGKLVFANLYIRRLIKWHISRRIKCFI